MRFLLIGTAALALTACANTTNANGDDATANNLVLTDDGAVANEATPLPPSGGATAALKTAAGAAVGTVTASAATDGVTFTIDGRMLPAGLHGVHVHGVGQCAGPAFTSAGPHWNPTGKLHGKDNPMGPHEGDLPNLEIGAGGTGTVTFTVKGATMTGATGLLDGDGAAIVVHAKADDYKTDPSGASGDRIACGVFVAS